MRRARFRLTGSAAQGVCGCAPVLLALLHTLSTSVVYGFMRARARVNCSAEIMSDNALPPLAWRMGICSPTLSLCWYAYGRGVVRFFSYGFCRFRFSRFQYLDYRLTIGFPFLCVWGFTRTVAAAVVPCVVLEVEHWLRFTHTEHPYCHFAFVSTSAWTHRWHTSDSIVPFSAEGAGAFASWPILTMKYRRACLDPLSLVSVAVPC